jgi:hypothetical protein
MMGSETSYKGAAVDIIKGCREQPVIFGVVDFEAAVFGDAVGGV